MSVCTTKSSMHTLGSLSEVCTVYNLLENGLNRLEFVGQHDVFES
jgi:hypothetical protein